MDHGLDRGPARCRVDQLQHRGELGLCRVFDVIFRTEPFVAGRSRTRQDRPRDLSMLVTGTIPLLWRVKDSNLRRLSRRIYRPSPSSSLQAADQHEQRMSGA